MGRKHYKAEQVIGMLRQAEVLQGQGMTIGEVSRKLKPQAEHFRTDVLPLAEGIRWHEGRSGQAAQGA